MPSLCRFGRAVVGAVEYYVDDDGSISNEWNLYGEIESVFRNDGWVDGSEAEDLKARVEELEAEVTELETNA